MKSRRHFIKLGGLTALGINTASYALEPGPKAFIHGFNFKFKRGVPEDIIAPLMEELAALKDKIPVLKEFFIGKNVAKRTHGFQYGEIAVFNKKEDLMIYEKHLSASVRKILPRLEIEMEWIFFRLVSPIRNLAQ